MPTEYTQLVAALKALTQGEAPNKVTLPMAEDDWSTRPETVSYGTVRLDFEVDALYGDNIKTATSYEGTVDLYSLQRDGAEWVPLITATLTAHCEGAWSLYSHMYERNTGLFHWTWSFQVEG